MQLDAGGRLILVGQTGSGKSYAARYLLRRVPRLIVCDAKGEINAPKKGWGEKWLSWEKGVKELHAGRPARILIPPPLDDREWEDLFLRIMPARNPLENVLIYIDELYGVGPPAGTKGLKALYTRGRWLNLGVWGATQRPTGIPLYAITETQYRFMFRLDWQDDRDRMAGLMGNFNPSPPLRNHEVVFWSAETGAVRKNRIQDFGA